MFATDRNVILTFSNVFGHSVSRKDTEDDMTIDENSVGVTGKIVLLVLAFSKHHHPYQLSIP